MCAHLKTHFAQSQQSAKNNHNNYTILSSSGHRARPQWIACGDPMAKFHTHLSICYVKCLIKLFDLNAQFDGGYCVGHFVESHKRIPQKSKAKNRVFGSELSIFMQCACCDDVQMEKNSQEDLRQKYVYVADVK